MNEEIHAEDTDSADVLQTSKVSRQSIVSVFQQVRSVLRDDVGLTIDKASSQAAFLLLLKITCERLGVQIGLENGPEAEIEFARLSDHIQQSLENRVPMPSFEEHFIDILKLLNQVHFMDANAHDMLNAIDEVFFPYAGRYSSYRVPRLLIDFLVKLASVNQSDCLLDPFSLFGDVAASVGISNLRSLPRQIRAFCPNENAVLWTLVQHYVVSSSNNLTILDSLVQETSLQHKPEHARLPDASYAHATRAVFVPPFGTMRNGLEPEMEEAVKGIYFASSRNNYEDVYVALALRQLSSGGRLVAIVPDGMLFSPGKRRGLRDFLVKENRLRAVISLPGAAAAPYSNIKMSVIVVDSGRATINGVYFASIDTLPLTSSLDSRDVPILSQIITELEAGELREHTLTGLQSRYINQDSVQSDNLTANWYIGELDAIAGEKDSPYPVVELKSLVKSIKRGQTVNSTLEDDNGIVVITPGAIRPMLLDLSGSRKVRQDATSTNAPRVQTGDVLINNISTYLGAAVEVPQDTPNAFANQHIIVLRPDESKILSPYLAAAINSDYVKPQISRQATGTIIPSLTLQAVSRIQIPLPDLDTQQAIVDEINKASDEVTTAKERLVAAETTLVHILGRLHTGKG